MPSVILILLIVAAVGVGGSIALIILMSILNIRANRAADEEFEDDYDEDYEEEDTDTDTDTEHQSTKGIETQISGKPFSGKPMEYTA